MRGRKGSIPVATINAMRACKAAHPTWGAYLIKKALCLPYTPQAVDQIIYNRTYKDAKYSPVTPGQSVVNGKTWMEQRQFSEMRMKRRPSIDYPFHCPTCGGNYGYKTMDEAMACCKIPAKGGKR